jgi:hypothetical protein
LYSPNFDSICKYRYHSTFTKFYLCMLSSCFNVLLITDNLRYNLWWDDLINHSRNLNIMIKFHKLSVSSHIDISDFMRNPSVN